MFVVRNNTRHDRNNLHILGWHTGESPDVFTVFGSVLLRSDHPFHFTKNPRIMRNNSDGLRRRNKFTITDAEVAYWRRIHDLNQAEKPAVPIEKPAPVRQYIIQTFELFTTQDR